MRRMVCVLAAAVVVAALGARTVADEAGAAIARIVQGAGSDAERARKLLDAAKAVRGNAILAARLLGEAADRGTKSATNPEAFAAADEALDLLARMTEVPTEWREKRLQLYRLSYGGAAAAQRPEAGERFLRVLIERGDELAGEGRWSQAERALGEADQVATATGSPLKGQVAGRRERAAYYDALGLEVLTLKDSVVTDPKKLADRKKLQQLLMVEFDDPAEAAKWLADELEEAWRKNVALAAREPATLSEKDATDLARWYDKALTAQASKYARVKMLERAAACYERALKLHTTNDVALLGLNAAYQEVAEELMKAAMSGAATVKFLTLDLGGGVAMKLALISAGTFLMGSPADEAGREDAEGPQRRVQISKPFYMGTVEVTRGQFAAFVKDTSYQTEAEKVGWSFVRGGGQWMQTPGATWRKCGYEQTDDHPAVCVSHNDALAFCKWLSRKSGRTVRLPTEAEWEHACRAGSRTAFFYGDDAAVLGQYGWYGSNSDGAPHPAGRKAPNAWGLHDVHGNAWEWCGDWHGQYVGSASKVADPSGPPAGRQRVARGGSWTRDAAGCRSAVRTGLPPNSRYSALGFRVAVEMK